MHIAIRELKANLSRVLARARAGELIEVTSHNKPVARIVGIPEAGDDGLRRLVGSGDVSWSGRKPVFQPPLDLGPGGVPVSRIVLEDRN
jgi:prevent-host-death family protein